MKRLTRRVILAPPRKLAVMVWANAVVAKSGKPAIKFYLEYPKTTGQDGSERESSSFATSLARGGPRPMLFNPDGSDGPALLIERQVPGTLKWLVHPKWDVLEAPENYDLQSIHRLMITLESAVVALLFDQRGSFFRRRLLQSGDLDRLRQLGSLDALAALLYLGVEASLRADRRAGIMVSRYARQHLANWQCLAWMGLSNQRRVQGCYRDVLSVTGRTEVFREVEQWKLADVAVRTLLPEGAPVEPDRQEAAIDLIVSQLYGNGV